jgi:hypothetical protein
VVVVMAKVVMLVVVVVVMVLGDGGWTLAFFAGFSFLGALSLLACRFMLSFWLL